MVNFGAKLTDNIREEWRDQYIDYKALKKALKPLKSNRGKNWLARGMSGYDASDSDEEPPAHAARRTLSFSLNGSKSMSEKSALLDPSRTASSYTLEDNGHDEEEHEQRVEESKSFEALVRDQLRKVEAFYTVTVEDLGHQLGFLKATIRGKGAKSTTNLEEPGMMAPRLSEYEIRKLKNDLKGKDKEKEVIESTLMRLNREIALLENFCILNYTGFVKILKKHDKMMPRRLLAPTMVKQEIDPMKFKEHIELEAIKSEVTLIFADIFCNKDKSQAMAMLLPKRSRSSSDYFLLHLGYKLGVAATLALWVVWDCVVQVAKFGKPTIVAKMGFPVFRAVGGLLLLHWCWGILENTCNFLRINFVYLLDLSPKHVSSPRAIFDEAVNESIVYLTCMLLYYKVLVGGFPDWIPAGYYPLILVIYTITRLIFPWKQRKGIWLTLGRVVCAPMFEVTFLDTVVADMLTSLVKVLLDMVWAGFYFFSGDFLRDVMHADAQPGPWMTSPLYSKVLAPLVVISPLWWRFMQCLRRYSKKRERWPHLANAGKYALAQTVTLFGAFHHVYYHRDGHVHRGLGYDIIWIFVTILSTLYSYVWDVTQDWGLGNPHKRFLNDRRMYGRELPYYTAIVADLFLRFLWVNTLIPPGSGGLLSLPLYLNAFLMVMEIIRRSFWGVLRLENEQLRNTQGFRRVDVIPLSFATEGQHAYQDSKKQDNMKVVLEVSLVAGLVIFLSIGAVVVADGIDET